MQAADFERERKNLQELISRLEVHLSEQTKLVEEVRRTRVKRSSASATLARTRNAGKRYKPRNVWKRCKTP